MKIIKYLLLVFSFALFFTTPVHAADMRDNMVPQEDKKQVGDVELDYNKYPHSRYSLDTHIDRGGLSDFLPWNWLDAAQNSMFTMLSALNSLMWQLASVLGLWTGQIVQWAFTLELMDPLIDYADRLIYEISGLNSGGVGSQGIFPMLAKYMILTLGVWFAYTSMVKRNTTLALGGLLKTIFVLALAITYVLNAGPILKSVNNASQYVSTNLLALTSSVATPDQSFDGEEGYANMRNAIFQTMNYQPWLLLNFGTMDVEEIQNEYKKDGNRIDDLLSTKDFTEERMKQVEYEAKEQENINMKPELLVTRTGILMFTIFTNGLMGAILLLMSGSAIFFSFLAIIFSIVGPIALLIALLPGYGANALTWVNKLIHPFLVKIGLCFLMTILFTIQSVIHSEISSGYGYFGNMVIYIIFTVGLWFARHQILSLITSPTRSSGINNNAFQNTGEYKSSYDKYGGHAKRIARPFTKKATPENEKWFNKVKYNPGVGALYRNWRAYTTQNTPKNNSGSHSVSRTDPELVRLPNPAVEWWKEQHRQKQAAQNYEPSKEDLNSLDRTTEKGGWGYHYEDNNSPAPTSTDRNLDDLEINDWKDKREPKQTGDIKIVQPKKEIPNHVVERRTGENSK